ncbi:MAG: hypothetical protein PHT69_02310 [Bacteroidales bacterium]|nr:hypothetical protein [Bacteroidales bacterium]
MKILSDKEHEYLTDKIATLQEELSWQKDTCDNLTKQAISNARMLESLSNELENLTIRRIIVGKNASGKTTYIKKHILPQLSNYFLIDPHNEYPDISHTRKLSNCSSHPELIYDIILAHKEKVIIVEDANVLYGDTKFQHKLMNLFMDRNFQFVFVYHSYKHAEWLARFTNVIYSFGATDGFTNNNEIFNDKIILKKFNV